MRGKTCDGVIMKICTWNINKATKKREGVWQYLLNIDADIIFLQEVNSIPEMISSKYMIVERKAITKNDTPQKFSTVILVKGKIKKEIKLYSKHKWVNQEIERFKGNLVAAKIVLDSGFEANVISVYSPAWSINKERWQDKDISNIKLKNNPELWLTEILYAGLLNENINNNAWIVGGDLNSSLTFDSYPSKIFQGNLEIQERMTSFGFIECLNKFNNNLIPTFRNPKDGKIIHQMDHLFVTQNIYENIINCETGYHKHIFDGLLSDHLPIIAEFKENGSFTK